MLQRLGHGDQVIFSGGVANNPFVVQALARKLGVPVLVPQNPTIIGALGAALHRSGSPGIGPQTQK